MILLYICGLLGDNYLRYDINHVKGERLNDSSEIKAGFLDE